MKQKLLIDSISLLSPLTGIGRYTHEIAKYIEKDNNFKINYFYGYYSKKLIHPSDKENIKILKSLISRSPFIKKIIRKVIIIYSKIITPKYDIYWQPSFIPNLCIKTNKIITSVHDFTFVLHRDFHPKERIEYFEKYFFKNVVRSDIIITGSEFSKQEILEQLNFPPEKVKVIYHGIDHELFRVSNDLNLNFELPSKFIFSVGSIEPRKNLLGLLEAYNLLDDSLKKEYKLVLAGFKGWENKEIMTLIERNKENIHYLGFISDFELVKVYNLATCFIFTSFYEGFGLPVLESMACGTPVICSNTTSMPEVGGDAVIYCNPYDVEDIKNQIKLVLFDKNLQQEMIKKGLERAKLFSWEKSAKEHIKVFKEVLSENSINS